MAREHRYATLVEWSDDKGTTDYRAYTRDHVVTATGKAATIAASSDPAFRGDASRYNPEELLVASLSACHMLWFLHLAAEAGEVITAYCDRAEGRMVEDAGGGGRFAEIVLRPEIAGCDAARAAALHERAHQLCFIARSVNFPVTIVMPGG